MNSKQLLLTVASSALFLPMFGSTSHATTLLASVPTHLRGSWYTTEKFGHTTEVTRTTLTKKHVITTTYEHGKRTFHQSASVVKPWRSTIKPHVIIKKGTHGWYGLSWTNANGVRNIKRGTYKLNGHKYTVLFNNDWNAAGGLSKKVEMKVGFKHPTKKPYFAKLPSKGMFAM